ncbi:uncharacterized protein BT62DRAFT_260125 [Guyanagaster necrorhizus]|uniref:Uncharacterized protein n=1 Tax=Guyanagaster necrorhizus TaxID=856835 RepID=A0A9P7VPR2_9AGAR|nr:uncharacterized protein BT62DRAFT_260125 [Guyanagaster necrorhizus MCA 3950]KAG7444225.1 hypothetical protein BT62DRAFT_260125 [Guyanagaster necrorhizus MCA 3950]
MALTQTATLPGPGPSWDEEVVPALRKRLEKESRTLARRISAISITSLEDVSKTTAGSEFGYRGQNSALNPYQSNAATSLPRPFQQQARTALDRGSSSSRVTPAKSSSTRSRTYSQPYSSDSQKGRLNGKPSSLRSTSPRHVEAKPTRIPKPTRSRAGSTSSHNYAVPGNSSSPYGSPQSTTIDPDLWIVHEQPAAASRSTISETSRQQPVLLNEPPPFKPESPTSLDAYQSQESFRVLLDDPPRPSMDSEEHPFEHWYRGDVSRNGGVGELRVGRRQEMLEIANFGHSLRTKTEAPNALTNALEEGRRRRRRADSVGATERRGSFHMEEDGVAGVTQVMDEHPLTDLDGEASDAGNSSDYYTPYSNHNGVSDAWSTSTPGPTATRGSRSATPTSHRPSSRQQPSRIPTPTHQMSEHSRLATPTQIVRGSSEPPFASTSYTPPSRTQTKTASPTLQQKRGASPASLSATSKSRTTISKVTRAKNEALKKERDEEAKRRSVGHYPTPNDDMRDAIPTWTEPVPREGNWDDVVLPVVARKKGLDGHYEQADGSPKPRPTEKVIAPAPGTFGYDHSKYRPPLDGNPDDVLMDEFGRPNIDRLTVEDVVYDGEPMQQRPQPPPISTNHDRTPLPVRMQPPASPVPFSHYAPNTTAKLQPVSAGAAKLEVQEPRLEEEDAGGCCKCVVM